MDEFINYLQHSKDIFNSFAFQNIHIVIGNESCDLDSCISSLALSYFINKSKTLKLPEGTLIIPVQNVSKEDFLLRTESCFVLRTAGISLDLLVYRDNIDFENLVTCKNLTSSLVDHHVLSKQDEVLAKTVKQIFDHRPIDASSKWNVEKVQQKIVQVGSCTTLIADEILKCGEQYMFKELAHLLYQTIVYDTIALLPENGKAKELDLEVAKKLETMFNFTEDRQLVFDRLWEAHNDVSHITPKQLLSKDLKIVNDIPVPGLPMLVENYLKLDGSYAAITSFAAERKALLMVLIGLEAKSEVRRDVAIFYKRDAEHIKDLLLADFYNSNRLKNYDFSFTQIKLAFDDIVCLRQNNIKLSRKQIIPLIKDVINKK